MLRSRQMLALTIMVICLVGFVFGLRWFISEKSSSLKGNHGVAGSEKVEEGRSAKPEGKIQDIACDAGSSERDCPLRINAYEYKLPHPYGSDIDGIKWNETAYSDVRVILTNTSLTRIQNISLILKPETHVAKAVQPTNVPGVIISPDFGPFGEASITVKENKTGTLLDIPAGEQGGYIVPQVRLQGSELLADGIIKIVLACVAVNPVINGQFPKTALAPRRLPKWIRVHGSYETNEAGSYKRFHYNATFTLEGH